MTEAFAGALGLPPIVMNPGNQLSLLRRRSVLSTSRERAINEALRTVAMSQAARSAEPLDLMRSGKAPLLAVDDSSVVMTNSRAVSGAAGVVVVHRIDARVLDALRSDERNKGRAIVAYVQSPDRWGSVLDHVALEDLRKLSTRDDVGLIIDHSRALEPGFRNVPMFTDVLSDFFRRPMPIGIDRFYGLHELQASNQVILLDSSNMPGVRAGSGMTLGIYGGGELLIADLRSIKRHESILTFEEFRSRAIPLLDNMTTPDRYGWVDMNVKMYRLPELGIHFELRDGSAVLGFDRYLARRFADADLPSGNEPKTIARRAAAVLPYVAGVMGTVTAREDGGTDLAFDLAASPAATFLAIRRLSTFLHHRELGLLVQMRGRSALAQTLQTIAVRAQTMEDGSRHLQRPVLGARERQAGILPDTMHFPMVGRRRALPVGVDSRYQEIGFERLQIDPDRPVGGHQAERYLQNEMALLAGVTRPDERSTWVGFEQIDDSTVMWPDQFTSGLSTAANWALRGFQQQLSIEQDDPRWGLLEVKHKDAQQYDDGQEEDAMRAGATAVDRVNVISEDSFDRRALRHKFEAFENEHGFPVRLLYVRSPPDVRDEKTALSRKSIRSLYAECQRLVPPAVLMVDHIGVVERQPDQQAENVLPRDGDWISVHGSAPHVVSPTDVANADFWLLGSMAVFGDRRLANRVRSIAPEAPADLSVRMAAEIAGGRHVGAQEEIVRRVDDQTLTAPPPPPRPSGGRQRPKAQVVGAGVLGLFAALRLQQQGHDVTIIDDAIEGDLTDVDQMTPKNISIAAASQIILLDDLSGTSHRWVSGSVPAYEALSKRGDGAVVPVKNIEILDGNQRLDTLRRQLLNVHDVLPNGDGSHRYVVDSFAVDPLKTWRLLMKQFLAGPNSGHLERRTMSAEEVASTDVPTIIAAGERAPAFLGDELPMVPEKGYSAQYVLEDPPEGEVYPAVTLGQGPHVAAVRYDEALARWTLTIGGGSHPPSPDLDEDEFESFREACFTLAAREDIPEWRPIKREHFVKNGQDQIQPVFRRHANRMNTESGRPEVVRDTVNPNVVHLAGGGHYGWTMAPEAARAAVSELTQSLPAVGRVSLDDIELGGRFEAGSGSWP
jgi:hypothetical protein